MGQPDDERGDDDTDIVRRVSQHMDQHGQYAEIIALLLRFQPPVSVVRVCRIRLRRDGQPPAV